MMAVSRDSVDFDSLRTYCLGAGLGRAETDLGLLELAAGYEDGVRTELLDVPSYTECQDD